MPGVSFNGPNRFKAPCAMCGKMVPAGIGILGGSPGAWTVHCQECHERLRSAKPIVRFNAVLVLTEDGRVSVSLDRQVSSAVFAQFKQAVTNTGFLFDPTLNTNAGELRGVPELMDALQHAGFDVVVDSALTAKLQAKATEARGDVVESHERADEVDKMLAKRGQKLYPFQRKSVAWLAPRTTGLLANDPGLGKAQPLDAKILTPLGWSTMGEMRPGCKVIGSDGTAKTVLAVFPQGKRKVYRVSFQDGSSTECDGEHLWEVYRGLRTKHGYAGKYKAVKTLNDIVAKGVRNSQGTRQYRVRTVAPVEFYKNAPLPMDAYLLGILLGDGSFTSRAVSLTTADQEILTSVAAALPAGVSIKKSGKSRAYDYRISREVTGSLFDTEGGVGSNPVRNSLAALGLAGCDSFSKFIPGAYLLAPIADRIALLQGLIDTDGYVNPKCGSVFYYTVSKRLAADVVFIIKSLGGIARCSVKQPTYKYKGEKRRGADCYVLTISLPPCITPCRLTRKRDLVVPKTKYQPAHYMDSVQYVGEKETQCILVDSDDHLYVTDDFILTHNTSTALVALGEKAPVLIVAPAVAKRVWLKEICNFRPDYGTCKERTRAGLTFLEPDKGISILEGRDSFRWPKPGEVVITNYDILPLTPGEHDDARTLVEAWEARGRPDEFTWTPPPTGDSEPEEEEVTADDIRQAQRFADMKPVTAPPAGTVLIADEAHIIKSRRAQAMSARSRRFRAVAEYVRSMNGRTWLLTGTPLLNEPAELWSVLMATGCANQVFGSRKMFDKLFHKNSSGAWSADPKVPKLLQRCMLRYSKYDVLKELPPKTREHVKVSIAPSAKEELDRLFAEIEAARKLRFEEVAEREQIAYAKEEMKRLAAAEQRKKKQKQAETEEEEEAEELSEADAMRKAQETALARSKDYIEFEEISRVRSILANAKIPAALKIVQEYADRKEPVLVFADHIEPVAAIYERFGREAGGWAIVTGAITPKKRSAIEMAFQRGKLNGIAATIGSSGVALTLTRAKTAIFIEENWTPALNIQAQDRLHRIGQFSPVTIRVLVADHVMDEHIARINKKKIELIEATIDRAARDPNEEVLTDAEAFERAARLATESTEAAAEAAAFEALERERPDLVSQGPTRTSTGGVVLPGAPASAGTRPTASAPAGPASPPAPSAPPTGKTRRGPRDSVEEWAARSLKYLAACDQDRACVINQMGFSKFDGEFGHSLAQQADRGLTDAQWAAAIRLASRYHRQVGAPPGKVSRNPAGTWDLIILDSDDRGELGLIGCDDVKARMIPYNGGATVSRLHFPKALYEPEECAAWAEAHGLPWARVEG